MVQMLLLSSDCQGMPSSSVRPSSGRTARRAHRETRASNRRRSTDRVGSSDRPVETTPAARVIDARLRNDLATNSDSQFDLARPTAANAEDAELVLRKLERHPSSGSLNDVFLCRHGLSFPDLGGGQCSSIPTGRQQVALGHHRAAVTVEANRFGAKPIRSPRGAGPGPPCGGSAGVCGSSGSYAPAPIVTGRPLEALEAGNRRGRTRLSSPWV